MGQRGRILSQITGFRGFRVMDAHFENAAGERAEPVAGYDVPRNWRLVLTMARRWTSRCANCFAICGRVHEQRPERRWQDLPWADHPVQLAYAPVRVHCSRCDASAVELLAWADPHHRQTRRFQQHIALDAASMPLLHIQAKHGMSWHAVRRAELAALDRWERTRPAVPLRQVGVDEKWLGRRHKRAEKFVTIVSNLETGEPVAIRYGRDEAALKSWLDTLTLEQKREIGVFACDMHRPFLNAIRADPDLAHAAIVHDPFHVMKRAGEAISELRREVFFRASAELRAVGRGSRWLVLRAWERTGEEDRARLRKLFSLNCRLANAYQVVEELRATLRAPTGDALSDGLSHILLRTERRTNVPLRGLHDSLVSHWTEIVALGEHRPPTGRIEALNNNWETLVRRGRGYRDHNYLLRKLRFMTANPVHTDQQTRRFLALNLPVPLRAAA
jgi:transposase